MKKVDAWETSDGRIFTCEETGIDHEVKLKAIDSLVKLGYTLDLRGVADWADMIYLNKEAIIKILTNEND